MTSIAKQYAQTDFTGQDVTAGSLHHIQDPRQYPRKPHRKPISFNFRDQQYNGIIKNVSRCGVFIETSAKFQFGQSIILVIPNNPIDKIRQVRGWMVRSSRRGIGVTFKRINDRRSGRERRHAIDRRIGLDRRKTVKPKNRHRNMNLLSPAINIRL
jgi:hypothetical protein